MDGNEQNNDPFKLASMTEDRAAGDDTDSLNKTMARRNKGEPETMSSREIARITGKRHDHVVRDIKVMCEQMEWSLPKFGDTYINPQNGQEYTQYNLPRFECEVLITGYDVKRRAAVIERWHDLESGKATPMVQLKEPPLPVDPHTQLEKNIASTRSAVALAEALGFTGNQKLLSADRMLKSQIGFSPLEAMGQKAFTAPVQEMTFTPTQLGQMMTPPINPREVNTLLASAGMQNKLDTQWLPTELGIKFCEILDTGKAHNSGTPVKQVKWYKTVLQHLVPDPPESSTNQEANLPEGMKMADPDKEPGKSRPGRKLRPGLTRNSIRKRGRYDLEDYFSVIELADELELTKSYVTEVLEKHRIIKWKGNGKAGKYIFTDKGWRYGQMYNPSDREFHNQHSKRLMTTNCQPVFGYDILDLF